MDADLKQYLDEMEVRANSHMYALEERLNARIEHVETALLTEFNTALLRALDLDARIRRLEEKDK